MPTNLAVVLLENQVYIKEKLFLKGSENME
jgi:hypothetical protein